MKPESFRARLADHVLSGHAFLHCPTTEKTRFIAELKALAESLPDVAAKLSQACQALKNHILNPDVVSQLTGRLKRRVVLE